MKNSPLLAIFLVIVAVVSGYYAWRDPSKELEENIPQGRTNIVNNVDPSSLSRFDLSGGVHLKFSPPRKNLFSKLFPPPPAKPTPKVVPAPIIAPEPVVIAPPPPPPPVVVRSPMPNFQILGFLEKQKQLIAFVSLQGKIHLVKKNQQFADEFRVADLDSQLITIARINGAGEVKLPLVDAKGGNNLIPSGPKVQLPSARPVRRMARPTQLQAAPFVLPSLSDDQAPPAEVEPPPSEAGSNAVEVENPAGMEAPPAGIEVPPTDAVPTIPGNESN